MYNKDTLGYSCEQRWFNLFVDIQAQQDAPTQDKGQILKFKQQQVLIQNFEKEAKIINGVIITQNKTRI
jgi:hypothetical protein